MVAIHPQEIGRGPLMAQTPMIMDTRNAASQWWGPLEQWILLSKCSKHWLWNMMFGSLVGPNYQRPWQHTAQPCKCWNSNTGDSFHILSPSSHLGMLQTKKSNKILINKSVKQFEGSLWYTIFGLLVLWGDPSIIKPSSGKRTAKNQPLVVVSNFRYTISIINPSIINCT